MGDAAGARGAQVPSDTVIACLQDRYPGVESLRHSAVLFLIFSGSSIPFSMVAAPLYIPTRRARGLLVSTCSSQGNGKQIRSLWLSRKRALVLPVPSSLFSWVQWDLCGHRSWRKGIQLKPWPGPASGSLFCETGFHRQQGRPFTVSSFVLVSGSSPVFLCLRLLNPGTLIFPSLCCVVSHCGDPTTSISIHPPVHLDSRAP